MPDTLVTVDFGEPTHGWLPVAFHAGAFQLEFDASAVPANPLEALCEALAVVWAGGSAQVSWFLEPAEYWFDFENQAGKIALTIRERASRAQAVRQLVHLMGTPDDLLVPFYHALREFAARAYSTRHWPRLDTHRLTRLGQLLENQR